MADHLETNFANWNSRVVHHERGYDLDCFRSDPGPLSSVVSFDLAARLAADGGATIHYVESELYGALEALGAARFDLVYNGIGALCWLPDIRGWARVIAELQHGRGGRLFMREGHPMLLALADPRPDGLLVVEHPYFETAGVHFSDVQSYVDHDEPLASPDIVSINLGLAEIITAVMDDGLTRTGIEEVPWNPLDDAMELIDCGE